MRPRAGAIRTSGWEAEQETVSIGYCKTLMRNLHWQSQLGTQPQTAPAPYWALDCCSPDFKRVSE
jgi:hypothetical protein